MTEPTASELGRMLGRLPRRLQDRVCVQCGVRFPAVSKRARYHSNACRQQAKYQRARAAKLGVTDPYRA